MWWCTSCVTFATTTTPLPFTGLVESVLPDYKERERLLRR